MIPEKTLTVMSKEGRILLGMKKRGFGEGKWNGFGGKIEEGESKEEAAVRELKEESGVDAIDYYHAGKIMFKFADKPEWNQLVHLFVVKEWEGEAIESEEMKPKWFDHSEIPYSQMWEDDIHWLALVMNGHIIDAEFVFEKDKIKNYKINKK